MFSGTLFRQNIFNNLLRFLTALRISEFIQGLSRERTPTILLGRPTYIRLKDIYVERRPTIYILYKASTSSISTKISSQCIQLRALYTLYRPPISCGNREFEQENDDDVVDKFCVSCALSCTF
jgi:hypothetical protein